MVPLDMYVGSPGVSMLERLRSYPSRFHSGWDFREGEEPLSRVKGQDIETGAGRDGIS